MVTSHKQPLPPALDRVPLSTPDAAALARGAAPHAVERRVREALTADPHLQFSSLTVNRVRDGICLTGVVQSDGGTDVAALVRKVSGFDQVINRLLVQPSGRTQAGVPTEKN